MRNAHRILVGKAEGNRPRGRDRHSWEDIIKIVRKEMRCEGMD